MPPETPARRAAPTDAGLTLLELLVVVTILVVLTVAIGTVALNYLGGARADAARLQINQLEGALDLYRLDMGRYPSESEGLQALVEAPAGAEGWNGPYLRKEAALTDPWGAPLRYALPAGQGGPEIVSLGAGGQPGGEGDDADISSAE